MKKKVLVVDDDPSILLVLETAFEAWGYDVEQAVDGEEALQIMRSEGAPRMVILDWMMPGVTGPEVCRKIPRHLHQYTAPHHHAHRQGQRPGCFGRVVRRGGRLFDQALQPGGVACVWT